VLIVACFQLSKEKEEQERRELRRMLMGEPSDKDGKDKKKGGGREEMPNLVSSGLLFQCIKRQGEE
jgi:hypothetical protein